MKNNYQILISKLDFFIRKYYKNQVIRGGFISIILIILTLLSAIIIEYFANFSAIIRTYIFFTILIFFLFNVLYYIIRPILKLYKIGRIIDHKAATKIISNHFGNIQDKLINTIELYEMKNISSYSSELVLASIDSRIESIKPIPFQAAVNYKENFKYLKYFGIITICIFLSYIIYPKLFNDSTNRLVNFSQEFEKEAPFSFIILNDSLSCKKGDDFTLKISTKGVLKPKSVYIYFGGNDYLMTENKNNEFEYLFKNLNSKVNFKLSSLEFFSKNYKIDIFPTPLITKFQITISPPAYTGEEERIIENSGDINIPDGTKVKWEIFSEQTDKINFLINDTFTLEPKYKKENIFEFEKNFKTSSEYKILLSNKFFKNQTALKYYIKVIPDLFPNIRVISVNDSIKKNLIYFKGIINDDYGFNNLNFIYVSKKEGKRSLNNISINQKILNQEFYYSFDFSSIKNSSGDIIEYYFEVSDNDKVNGSKTTKSNIQEFKISSQEELEKQKDNASKSAQSKLSESQKLAEELQKKVSDLKRDLINKNLSDWEKSKKIDEIISKQEQLEKKIFEIQSENRLSNELNTQLTKEQQDILDKQKQLEELLNNIFDDELKKMLEELKELMSKMETDKVNELAEKMEISYEDLAKQLEKDLELLKKMEIEQKLNQTIEKLNELSKEQEKLSEDLKEKDSQENLNKQDELNKKLEDIEKDYNELQKKNSELENPEKLNEFNQEFDDIKNEMNESKENLNKANNNKASKSQKSSADKMKKLSDKMKEMQKKNTSMKEMQNMEDLRQIIDNLVQFSFSQEEQLIILQKLGFKDPKIDDVKRKQQKLKDDFIIIKDSLYALSKKTPMLSNIINKEIIEIEHNFKKIESDFSENRTYNVKTSQQFIMTSANNLALLLSEILKQMQQQMQQQMSGESQCENPKNGNPMPGMQKQQKSLKQQMEQMLEQMKNGKGKQMDKNSMNKQLGKMMAQQEIFGKMLNDLKTKSSLSPDAMKKLNEISQLNEQNLKDLINKNINPQLLNRQELILTKLLEAENSMQEREIEKKRESKEGKNEDFRNPEDFFKYKRINSNFDDILNLSNIEMSKYYMDKYKEYIINLNKNEN